MPAFSAHAEDWCIPALRHVARDLALTHEVRVISVRYPYASDRYAIDGADVIALGGAVRRGPATLDLWRATLQTLQREHQRRPFEVLHAFWATESGLLAALAGRVLRIPTLVSLAGGELAALRDLNYGDQLVAWERLKVRASLRLASAVSGGSRWLLALAEQHVPRAKLHRAPLGVPLDLFKSREPPAAVRMATGPKLLHVGSLTAVKDQATLLRAFARLRTLWPRATVEIVGDGPLRGSLVGLAQALGVAQAVCWRGEVNHAALPEVYRAANLLVVSSRHEAQGMVALEAAACALAVAGTRVGVLPEITLPAAPLAEGGDADALARALSHTCEHAIAAAAFAHTRVEADFSLSVCTARFRQLYASLTGLG